MRSLIVIIALLLACIVATVAEAGIFFRRDGSRRTPIRSALRLAAAPVRAIAANREARGAPILLPRLRRTADCGPCGNGGKAATTRKAPSCYWQNGKLVCPVK